MYEPQYTGRDERGLIGVFEDATNSLWIINDWHVRRRNIPMGFFKRRMRLLSRNVDDYLFVKWTRHKTKRDIYFLRFYFGFSFTCKTFVVADGLPVAFSFENLRRVIHTHWSTSVLFYSRHYNWRRPYVISRDILRNSTPYRNKFYLYLGEGRE